LETTVTDKNLIQEEIKSILNSCNSSYHSVQNLVSSHLLSKNIKLKLQNYNFIRGFVWAENLVFGVKGSTLTEGI
jgi:hypothetical protein